MYCTVLTVKTVKKIKREGMQRSGKVADAGAEPGSKYHYNNLSGKTVTALRCAALTGHAGKGLAAFAIHKTKKPAYAGRLLG